MDPEPFTDGRLGTFDVVPHPTSGQRMTPDDMLNVVSLYQGAGRGLNVIDARVYKVAAAGLEASGLEVSVEKTALEIRVPATRLSGASTIHIDDSPHPGFGNGLFVLLRAPEIPGSPDIPRLANDLNRREIDTHLDCQSFGAWTSGPDGLYHVAFFPNYLFVSGDPLGKSNLLVNIAINEIIRSRWLDRSWDQLSGAAD